MAKSSRRKPHIRRAAGDLERIEGHFSGAAYAPHRHDTYTVGITLSGIQSFDYRGTTRHSLPGQLVILHPDELHDGRAGDGGMFSYRAAYIAPANIQEMLPGRPLPFVNEAVSDAANLRCIIMSLLSCLDMPLEKAEQEDLLYDLAIALQGTAIQLASVHLPNSTAAMRAREYINENTSSGFSLAHLETVTGHNRWQLSRDFRALFGTSPYRYLISLRLNEARRQMLKGAEIADAAHANGFSDQSHFGRLFKKQYGLTPKAWLAAVHQTAP